MGFALAEAFADRGFDVLLIAGPVHIVTVNPAIKRIDVVSADDMYRAVMQHFAESDVGVFCAAVADFTPTVAADHKIKRKADDLVIRLKPTQDIAAAAGRQKRQGQFIVGFALETDDEEANAVDKMQRKNLDMIVLNSLNDQGAGFGYDTNKVTVIERNGRRTDLPLQSKTEVARRIVEAVVEKLA
jgi:flavoprotein